MQDIRFDERNYIYIVKAFAIFSVVSAHSARISNETENMNYMASQFLTFMGTIGVPVFFILSGYLFYNNNDSINIFFRKRLNTIIIPWITCETIVWLYVVLRKGGLSIESLLLFLIGVGHSTYYLSVLMIFYLIYYNLKKFNWFLLLTSFISVISILSISYNGPLEFINEITITPYLNPLNWMLYFSLGLLLSKYRLLIKMAVFSKKTVWLTTIMLVIDIYLHIRFNISVSYWSVYAPLNITVSIFFVFGWATVISENSKNKLLVQVGKYSFTIYLLHELLVGIIVTLTSMCNLWILTIIRPVLVITILMVVIYILIKLQQKSKNELFNMVMKLMGIQVEAKNGAT